MNKEDLYQVPTILGAESLSAQTNGAFCSANIIDAWWKDDRLSRSGVANGTSYTFDNTEYNLARKDIRMYYSTAINPLYGFNDGTRTGRIEAWTRDLDTDYYSIKVQYQEDN